MTEEIIDFIYAGEDTIAMQSDIISVFPGAKFEDASDFIHRGRFEVNIKCSRDKWRLQMFLMGLFDLSIHMQFWRIEKPEEYIVMLRRAVEIKKQ